MNADIGTVFPIAIEEEGTVMDYVDDEFVCIIKDAVWTQEECEALKHHTFCVDFVYKYDIVLFLLTLEDAIDTSDFIFNVHDNAYPSSLFQSFEKEDGYLLTLYLIDASNIVCAKRRVRLSKALSNTIAESLRKQQATPFYEEEFTCNLEGLQSAWEPYELQNMALGSDTFTSK